jgi:hypothetical protein
MDRSTPRVALAFIITAYAVLPAFAAQRTFVSTTGVDNAACSLGAPCRAFAAAITATTAGGEVIVLDSGGYGRVTITKSVSIIAPAGIHAGISVFAATNGIDIPTGGIKVVLRGLAITGQGGVHGIYVTGNNALTIERCDISGMGTNGVFLDNVSGTLQMRDTVVHDNGGNGVFFFGPLSATLDHVSIERNALAGVSAYDGGMISIKDSALVRNDRGVDIATLTAGVTTTVNGDGLQISRNNHEGLRASASAGRVYIGLVRSTVDFNVGGALIQVTGAAGRATGTFVSNAFPANGNWSTYVDRGPGAVNSAQALIMGNYMTGGVANIYGVTGGYYRSGGGNSVEPDSAYFAPDETTTF